MVLWLQDQCGCHVTVKGGNIEVFQVHSNLCKTGKMNVYVCFLR